MLSQVIFELDVELDETEHGDGDRHSLENLHPYVGVYGRQAVFAVDFEVLREHRHDREEDSNEAILEHTYPDNLQTQSAYCSCWHYPIGLH